MLDQPTDRPPAYTRAQEASLILWLSMGLLLLAGVTVALLLVQQEPKNGSDTALLECGEEQQCDEVLTSHYSRVFGIPLTHWGFAFYAVFGIILLCSRFAWQSTFWPPFSLLLPVAASAGVFAAVWSLVVMVGYLRAFCPFCLMLHGVNLWLFVVAIIYARQDWRHRQYLRWRDGIPPLPAGPVILHGVATVLVGATVVGLMSLFHDEPDATTRFDLPPSALELMKSDQDMVRLLGVDDSDEPEKTIWTIKGPRDAPHRLVMFSCTTCPKCQQLHKLLNEVLEKHPGQVRLDVRFFPLAKCNERIRKVEPRHRHSCAHARYALAVAAVEPDAFSSYLDWLYEQADSADDDAAYQEAIRRVDKEKLDGVLESESLGFWRRFKLDMDVAREQGVRGVPRLFVKDGQVYGAMTFRTLEKFLGDRFGWEQSMGADNKEPFYIGGPLIIEHGRRGMALVEQGLYAEAHDELKRALSLKTDWPEIARELAWLLATCPDRNVRDGPAAVHFALFAEAAARKQGMLNDGDFVGPLYDTLAAAYAAAGNFEEAVVAAERALDHAPNNDLADEYNERYEMYHRGESYIQEAPTSRGDSSET